MDQPQPLYLTTKEVADLIRVKERKVYDLAAAGEIPHRRVTGKLLFPAAEITAWIEGGDGATHDAPNLVRPAVLTGSHDPLLDWAVRESASGLATLYNGSGPGLDAFANGEAALSGLHIPGPNGWNTQAVNGRGLTGCVLIGWAERSRGLLVPHRLAGQVKTLADLKGMRVMMRQQGAGAAVLFDQLMAAAGLSLADITAVAEVARTESDAAGAVAAGSADTALGIEAMARQYNLSFVKLATERFDILIDRRSYFTEPLQMLLQFGRSKVFADKAESLGGYDLHPLGTVRWVSP